VTFFNYHQNLTDNQQDQNIRITNTVLTAKEAYKHQRKAADNSGMLFFSISR